MKLKHVLNLVSTFVIPTFHAYYTPNHLRGGRYITARLDILGLTLSFGLGANNYFIFCLKYWYSPKYGTFQSINYNRRFGLWGTAGINNRGAILWLFGYTIIPMPSVLRYT